MRVGVIGLGSMGQNHARVISEIATLVAVCDSSDEALMRWRGPAGIKFCHSAKMLEDPDLNLEAVVVAVPTTQHFDVAMAVIAEGIPVLVEKPLVDTVAEADILVRKAEYERVFLATGHIERFNPAIIALKERWNELGKTRQIAFERIGPRPQPSCDTGVIYDLATHDFDLLRYLTGQAIIVSLKAETVTRNDRDVSVVGIARLNNGTIVSFRESWITPTKSRKVTVWGSGGMFVADLLRQSLTFYANDYMALDWKEMEPFFGVSEGNVTQYKIEKQEPLKLELQAFLDCVAQKGHECPTGRDGLEAVRIAELMKESAI